MPGAVRRTLCECQSIFVQTLVGYFTDLRPKPKLNELMSILILPLSSIQRLGRKTSGSGKASGSCEMALGRFKFAFMIRTSSGVPVISDDRGSGGYHVFVLSHTSSQAKGCQNLCTNPYDVCCRTMCESYKQCSRISCDEHHDTHLHS